jgi:hypothetical protein
MVFTSGSTENCRRTEVKATLKFFFKEPNSKLKMTFYGLNAKQGIDGGPYNN